MLANSENSAVATRVERSVFIPIPKKGHDKEYSNYHTISLIHILTRQCSKILQAKLQQYVNQELPDVQAGFRKSRGIRDQIVNIRWIIEKAREFKKNIFFCQNQIDYIFCSQQWRSSIQSAKTRPGADCGSDHGLLINKFRLKLKKTGKTARPFRYDLNQIPYDYTVEVRNRFKGLDLIDTGPDELWNEVCDIV